MIRPFFAVPVALAFVIPAMPALGQYAPSPITQGELPPAAGAGDDRYMYRPPAPGASAPSNILPYPEETDAAPLPDPAFVNPNAYGRQRQPAYGSSPDAYGRQQPGYQTDPNAYGRQQPGYQPDPTAYGRQQPGYQSDPNAYVRQQPGNPADPNPYGGQQPSSQAAPGDPYAIRPPAPVGPAAGAAPQPVPPSVTAALPPEDQPELGPPQELPEHLKRQVVDFKSTEPAGSIIVDTDKTFLYLTLGNNKAVRYGIGVGREGFTWSGTERISKMKEWPDWFPPAEMIERQPYLPRMMAGGPGNPLGARALYLGKTLYRIHGTNQPSTIGKTVSSGCIRLLNEDIEDLYSRVKVGTRVVVLASEGPETATATDRGAGGPAAPAERGSAAAGTLPPLR
jgi:lipoprotein-anchoring transpeptidase ErfK/SrfK